MGEHRARLGVKPEWGQPRKSIDWQSVYRFPWVSALYICNETRGELIPRPHKQMEYCVYNVYNSNNMFSLFWKKTKTTLFQTFALAGSVRTITIVFPSDIIGQQYVRPQRRWPPLCYSLWLQQERVTKQWALTLIGSWKKTYVNGKGGKNDPKTKIAVTFFLLKIYW